MNVRNNNCHHFLGGPIFSNHPVKDGNVIAEDEENCGTQSSSLKCESRFHNPMSSAVYATVFNVTYYIGKSNP